MAVAGSQRKVTPRRIARRTSLGLMCAPGLHPTTCIGGRRYPITNRRSVPPWKRRLPSSTLASRWPVLSCRHSRLQKSRQAAECVKKSAISISICARRTSSIRVKSARPTALIIGRRPFARISGSPNSVRVAGGFAYSPNVSNTGAWSWYAAAGLGYDVPSNLLPQDVGVSFTGGAGYSWFGNQSQELGGFPLPAYLNWQVGVTFTRKIFNLDLRYYDTNLSKENCFVFTGDPNARLGGSVDPVTNPEGLTSRWCSATFVAKFSFALN